MHGRDEASHGTGSAVTRTSSSLRALCCTAAAAATWYAARPAAASPEDVVLLPTALVTQRPSDTEPTLRVVEPEDGRALVAWTRQIDFTLGEAVQDLGLTLDVSGRTTVSVGDLSEDNLIARASESWVVSPRLEI